MTASRQPPRAAARTPADPAVALADRLHSAAIHLLRRLRAEDEASGLTGPRLSALSVIVFRGPITLGDLAAAEQVRPPTISRLVRDLEHEGLVRRTVDVADRRVQRVQATSAGARLLQHGRERRVSALADSVRALRVRDRQLLEQAVALLQRLAQDRSSEAAGDAL